MKTIHGASSSSSTFFSIVYFVVAEFLRNLKRMSSFNISYPTNVGLLNIFLLITACDAKGEKRGGRKKGSDERL